MLRVGLLIKETGLKQISNGLPWCLGGKESSCQGRRCRSDSWISKSPWRRKWKPTPVFLAWNIQWTEKPWLQAMWGHKKSNMTWWLNNNFQKTIKTNKKYIYKTVKGKMRKRWVTALPTKNKWLERATEFNYTTEKHVGLASQIQLPSRTKRMSSIGKATI